MNNTGFLSKAANLTEKIKEHIEHSEQVLLDSVNQWVASFILEKNTIMTPEQIEEALDLELKVEDLVTKYQQKKRIIFVSELAQVFHHLPPCDYSDDW